MNQKLVYPRVILAFFTIALFTSGITAIPLTWETGLLVRLVQSDWLQVNSQFPQLTAWIIQVNNALVETNRQYPYLAYGTDWLAFGHIVIAIAFLGALRDPIKNMWVIEFGMIACVLVVPWALIFGTLRGIPLFWRLIDCSFGLGGIIPLWVCRNMIIHMRRIEAERFLA